MIENLMTFLFLDVGSHFEEKTTYKAYFWGALTIIQNDWTQINSRVEFYTPKCFPMVEKQNGGCSTLGDMGDNILYATKNLRSRF